MNYAEQAVQLIDTGDDAARFNRQTSKAGLHSCGGIVDGSGSTCSIGESSGSSSGVVANGSLLVVAQSSLMWGPEIEAQPLQINVAVSPDEKRTECWLCEDVEDAIEDSLRVGADNVATLAQSP